VPGLIIFWNIARTQGAGVIAEDLQDDLSALQGACNPDVIVLCEAQKLTRRNLIAGNDLRLIGTYVAPAFAKAASVNHPPAPGLLAGGRVAAPRFVRNANHSSIHSDSQAGSELQSLFVGHSTKPASVSFSVGIQTVVDPTFHPEVFRIEDGITKDSWLRTIRQAPPSKRQRLLREDESFDGLETFDFDKQSDHWPIAIRWT
jgi:hypothetical protein